MLNKKKRIKNLQKKNKENDDTSERIRKNKAANLIRIDFFVELIETKTL